MKRQSIADQLRELSAGLVLDDTPCGLPAYRKKKVEPATKTLEVTQETPEGESETVKIPVRPKALPDETSKDLRQVKRPNIKPPRRISDYKAKWKGDGSRETRNDYQQQYRREHGNGYAKKIRVSSDAEGTWEQVVTSVFEVSDHHASRIASES